MRGSLVSGDFCHNQMSNQDSRAFVRIERGGGGKGKSYMGDRGKTKSLLQKGLSAEKGRDSVLLIFPNKS